MSDKYFLPDGYVANTRLATVEHEFGEYWHPARRAKAMDYQYDVYDTARELADRHSIVSVADFGCGIGAKLDHFFGHLHPTAFDQATVGAFVAEHYPRLRFCSIDLAGPTTPSERFELTICADVLEHLHDPDPAMELIRQTTSRFAVISTPERELTRGSGCMACTKREHVREWSEPEFRKYVESRGFRIVEHRLVPKERLSDAERARRDASSERTRLWHGCQMVVATPR